MVVKRVTITIDKSLDSRIREIQVMQILELNKSVSYSQILNQLLEQVFSHDPSGKLLNKR